MKIILYALISILLLLSATSCKLLFNTSDKNNNNKLDSVKVVKKDTQPNKIVVIKADTFRYCDTLPEKNNFRTVVCYEKINGKLTKIDTMAKILVKDTSKLAKIDSLKNAPKVIKNTYNIVIVLPFMSGGSNRSAETEAKSIRALEFYEGVQLAYDSLKREAISLNISVFDTKDNDSIIQTLLIKEEFLNADLIIGPMAGNELRSLAAFAQTYQKAIISPLNPKEISTEDNPYFIQFNPTARMQARNLVKFAELSTIRRAKNIVLVGTKDDSLAMEQFQQEYANLKRDPNLRVSQYMSPDGKFSSDGLKSQCKRGQCNLVLVLSNKESFVLTLARSLHESIGWKQGEVSTQEDYVLFGQSQWRYFETVAPEYFESTRLHILAESFADLTDPNTVRFKEAYFSKYGMPPREFAYTGFDLMIFFGRMLKKYGTDFRTNLSKEIYKGRSTSIKIEPVFRTRNIIKGTEIISENATTRYENTFLNIIKFEQFTFIKAY